MEDRIRQKQSLGLETQIGTHFSVQDCNNFYYLYIIYNCKFFKVEY